MNTSISFLSYHSIKASTSANTSSRVITYSSSSHRERCEISTIKSQPKALSFWEVDRLLPTIRTLGVMSISCTNVSSRLPALLDRHTLPQLNICDSIAFSVVKTVWVIQVLSNTQLSYSSPVRASDDLHGSEASWTGGAVSLAIVSKRDSLQDRDGSHDAYKV